MKTPLWIPSEERRQQANITRFIEQVNARHGLSLASYSELYQWSVENIPQFWAEVWDFAEIKYSQRYDLVVDDLTKFPGAKWFPGARLNFAENLLPLAVGEQSGVFPRRHVPFVGRVGPQMVRVRGEMQPPWRSVQRP